MITQRITSNRALFCLRFCDTSNFSLALLLHERTVLPLETVDRGTVFEVVTDASENYG